MNAQMCDFIVFCNILINHDNVRYVQWLSFFGVAKSAPLRDLVCWLAREKTDPKDLVTTDRPAGSRFVVADTQDLNWSLGFTDLWWRSITPYARDDPANSFAFVHLRHLRRAMQEQLEIPTRKSRHVSWSLDDVGCALCKQFAIFGPPHWDVRSTHIRPSAHGWVLVFILSSSVIPRLGLIPQFALWPCLPGHC